MGHRSLAITVVSVVCLLAVSGCEILFPKPRPPCGGAAAAASGAAAPCPFPIPDGGTIDPFCLDMSDRSATLRHVITSCPAEGDSQLTAFDQNSCQANQATSCTNAERDRLRAIAACEELIVPCTDAGERSRLDADLQNCSADAGTISTGCRLALGN